MEFSESDFFDFISDKWGYEKWIDVDDPELFKGRKVSIGMWESMPRVSYVIKDEKTGEETNFMIEIRKVSDN